MEEKPGPKKAKRRWRIFIQFGKGYIIVFKAILILNSKWKEVIVMETKFKVLCRYYNIFLQLRIWILSTVKVY